MKKKELRFKQIIAAQWKGDGSLTYSLYGLTPDGKVYRNQVNGWKPVSMKLWEEYEGGEYDELDS